MMLPSDEVRIGNWDITYYKYRIFINSYSFIIFCNKNIYEINKKKVIPIVIDDKVKSRTIELEIKNDELEKIVEKRTIQLKRIYDHLIERLAN